MTADRDGLLAVVLVVADGEKPHPCDTLLVRLDRDGWEGRVIDKVHVGIAGHHSTPKTNGDRAIAAAWSVIEACPHRDLEDGTCGHPDNPTPECHGAACPLVGS